MFDRSDLHDLYRYQPDAHLVSSLYLDVTPDRSPRELKTVFKSLTGETRKEIFPGKTEPVRSSLVADLERFEEYLETGDVREELTRTIALFSCDKQDFWTGFHVPDVLGDRYRVARYPYLRPLSAFLDQSHRTLVTLVDRGHASFLDVYMNRIVSRTTMTSEVPKDVREGGFKGFEEKRISRHTEKLMRKHLRRTAEHALKMFKDGSYDCLITGGSSHTLGALQDELHSYLKERLIGTVSLRPDEASDQEILSEVGPLIERAEEDDEQRVLEELRSEVGREGLGVLGLEETVERLNQKQVRRMVVDHEFEASGSMCPFCNTLQVAEAGPCPYCNKLTQPIDDLVDRMISATLREGGETEHIFSEDPKLKEAGIGALLYFK